MKSKPNRSKRLNIILAGEVPFSSKAWGRLPIPRMSWLHMISVLDNRLLYLEEMQSTMKKWCEEELNGACPFLPIDAIVSLNKIQVIDKKTLKANLVKAARYNLPIGVFVYSDGELAIAFEYPSIHLTYETDDGRTLRTTRPISNYLLEVKATRMADGVIFATRLSEDKPCHPNIATSVCFADAPIWAIELIRRGYLLEAYFVLFEAYKQCNIGSGFAHVDRPIMAGKCYECREFSTKLSAESPFLCPTCVRRNYILCYDCGREMDDDYACYCKNCEEAFCEDCIRICSDCRCAFCESCFNQHAHCCICGKSSEIGDLSTCLVCDSEVCEECSVYCEECDDVVCSNCIEEHIQEHENEKKETENQAQENQS